MVRKKNAQPDSAPVNTAQEKPADHRYVLRLYVVGATARSSKAAANIRKLCDKYLPGRYDLEIIDFSQDPELAEKVQLIAAPTLIKELPPPLRRFIGDMSQTDRLLIGLDLDNLPPQLLESFE